MSISEQVKSQISILRSLSFECHCQWKEELEFALSDAAGTIESLSAKLADMELSAENCGGGWIYCGDGKNLPEEHDSIFAESKGTEKWNESMFEKTSNTVIVTVEDKKGQRATTTARTLDGKWKVDSFAKLTVVAWRPFPEEYHG